MAISKPNATLWHNHFRKSAIPSGCAQRILYPAQANHHYDQMPPPAALSD